MRSVRPLLLSFILALCIGIALYAFFSQKKDEEEIPPYTPEIDTQLKKSHGFDALVMYAEDFQPQQTIIKKGQTVRFVNNSREGLWIAAAPRSGAALYPGVGECGASAFDSCGTIAPKAFWEFTFNEPGTWTFHDQFQKEAMGIIRVEL